MNEKEEKVVRVEGPIEFEDNIDDVIDQLDVEDENE